MRFNDCVLGMSVVTERRGDKGELLSTSPAAKVVEVRTQEPPFTGLALLEHEGKHEKTWVSVGELSPAPAERPPAEHGRKPKDA